MSNGTTESQTNNDVQVRGIKSTSDGVVLGAMELHGRKQIFTNETGINDGNVMKVLNDALKVHAMNRSEIIYLENYLKGIQPILERVKKYNDYVNNKIVVNIANEVVTFKTAEFAGEAIQYVSRGSNKSVPKKIEKLNAMMISEGKQSKDMDLAYKMFTAGVGYRLVLNEKAGRYNDLYDEAPYEVYIPEPRNTFVVRVNNVTKQIIMGVTYVYLDRNNVQYTVYTADAAYTITGTAREGTEIKSKQVHRLGIVPLVEYPCNSVYMGAFEVVLPLLDAINTTQSNRLDGIDQFIQAIMVFDGVDITREQFLELKDLGAINLPPAMDGRSSKVYYLNEQLDQSQTQTLVDDLYQTILQIVGMPSQGNANTSDSSNNGAILLKNGWWSAEARALETEGMWRQSETEFLKIVLKICSDANAINGLKLSDVQSKFGRRSYQDLLTKTQSFTMLIDAGVPPIQAYTVSGIVTDPEAASIQYEAYQDEKEDEMNRSLTEVTNREGTETVPTGGQDSGVVEREDSKTVKEN